MNTSLTDPGAMAQSAERSAYPAKYDQVQAEAQALLSAAGGATTGGTINTSDPTSSDPVSSITSWIQGSALRVGLIMFGALLMLVGMWLALGHKAQDLPTAVAGGLKS
jgi:hypothetical protein